MGLSVGIVGLPNVGKSTLFNALSSNQQAEAANYAFCTIEPNHGVVQVPDKRIDTLVKLYKPKKTIPATVDFVDIAGLVRGASKGEGKGNAFLSNIRDADAIAHVVRCFEDDNILHVDNKIDPLSDIETIETELILKDLETVTKRLDRARRMAKGPNKGEKKAIEICEELEKVLDDGRAAAEVTTEDQDKAIIIRDMQLITGKPMFFVCNVKEEQLENADSDPLVSQVAELAKKRGAPHVIISAAIEADIMGLPEEERGDFLESLGLEEPGLNRVIRTGYAMLNMITFFTCGPQEIHAWEIKRETKAPQAAGKIHTDFERGFIKAEVVGYDDMVEHKTESAAKAAGKMRLEGKEYIMADGDIVHFRFNV